MDHSYVIEMNLQSNSAKAELNRIARLPENRRFKYFAMAFGLSMIILLLITVLGLDSFSITTILILRGITGICAILFIIFVTVFLYRVYKAFFNHKNR